MKALTAIIMLFAVVNCSSEKCLKKNSDFIELKQLECWLNLMPGGNPSFHYTGEIIVKQVKNNFIINEIEFFVNEKSIHKSAPITESFIESLSEDNTIEVIRFNSPQNLPVVNEMMKTQFVDIRITFVMNNKKSKIFKKEVSLQRAY